MRTDMSVSAERLRQVGKLGHGERARRGGTGQGPGGDGERGTAALRRDLADRVDGAKLFFPEEYPDLIAGEARRLWGVG